MRSLHPMGMNFYAPQLCPHGIDTSQQQCMSCTKEQQQAELDRLRKENAALREDAERWKELTLQADDLLRTAWGAALKMGLANRGSDCGLSHEVRMFALHFSREGREGPGALQVTGDGKLHAWLDACARAALQGAKDD